MDKDQNLRDKKKRDFNNELDKLKTQLQNSILSYYTSRITNRIQTEAVTKQGIGLGIQQKNKLRELIEKKQSETLAFYMNKINETIDKLRENVYKIIDDMKITELRVWQPYSSSEFRVLKAKIESFTTQNKLESLFDKIYKEIYKLYTDFYVERVRQAQEAKDDIMSKATLDFFVPKKQRIDDVAEAKEKPKPKKSIAEAKDDKDNKDNKDDKDDKDDMEGTGMRKTNKWISHVKQVQQHHKCLYSEALKLATKTYKK
jgi:hypothetical protein